MIRKRTNTNPSLLPEKYRGGFLAELDGRTSVSIYLRRLLDDLYCDLGGKENLSFQQQVLCERAVFLIAKIQTIESKIAEDNKDHLTGPYIAYFNSLLGVLKTLGLKRIAKEVDLKQYIKKYDEHNTSDN